MFFILRTKHTLLSMAWKPFKISRSKQSPQLWFLLTPPHSSVYYTASLNGLSFPENASFLLSGTSSSVQSLRSVRLFATPWTAARQASLSITSSRSPPQPTSTESVMPSNHLTLCHPLLLLPSIFPSIRVFSNESALCIRWPKYWSFSFNISPSNEHPGLISFGMDWLDFLVVQGTLKSSPTPQFKSINTSALFILQLSL